MYQIDIQVAVPKSQVPAIKLLRHYAETALAETLKTAEVSIRVVDVNEMTHLNQLYRKKKGPTNVLSFPFAIPLEPEISFLGDIVICASVVNDEAKAQSKTALAHWAHMIVHGILHLQGYDHENAEDAEQMENFEIKILHQLAFANPYITGAKSNDHD